MKVNTLFLLAFAALGVASLAALTDGQVAAMFGIYAPPAQCNKWYDGCNMCTSAEDGSVNCSRRVCESKGKGFCSGYVSRSDRPSISAS